MTNKQLEQRLHLLEQQVASLQANDKARHGWRALIGLATDDPIMKEASRLALQYREEDRKKARKTKTRRKKQSIVQR